MFGIPQVYIYLILATGSAAAGAGITYKVQQSRIVSLEASIDSANASNAAKAVRILEQRIEDGEKIETRIKELANAEQAVRDDLVDDINRLQSKVTDLSRRLRTNTASPDDSEAAAKVGDLFQSCVRRYTELERFATEDRLAGLNCEERYDSLRTKILGTKGAKK